MSTYKEDGVDITHGDELSSFAAKKIQETWSNNPCIEVTRTRQGFRGPVSFRLAASLPFKEELSLSLGSDGVGTKVGLHDAAQTYALTAYDLIAMLADDIARYGGMPCVMSSVIDVKSTENTEAYRELFEGLVRSAQQANIVVLNGETAELGDFVGGDDPDGFRFLWSGTMFGLYHKDRMIGGTRVTAGDVVIALREDGFRSNGISTVRAAFRRKFGDNSKGKWWEHDAAKELLTKATHPSVCYSPFLNHLNGWNVENTEPLVQVKYIAHITGGGIVGKFGEGLLCARGLSAHLDSLFEPPEIMRECREWRSMSDEEAYKTWNGGQGALLVVSSSDVPLVLDTAATFGIDAQACGTIADEKSPTLTIESKFSRQTLVYPME